MRDIPNIKLIKRNRQIGQITSVAGLVVLVGGLAYSFFQTSQADPEATVSAYIPFITLFIGFILSNVGIYFANRYVRAPIPHQSLEKALKGLDDRYDQYHYYFPSVPHVLFSPSGVFVFVTRYQGGKIAWDEAKKRLVHSGGNMFRTLFGQEGMGNPLAELEFQMKEIDKFLRKHLPEERLPTLQGAIVFLNPDIELIKPETSPTLLIQDRDLKEHLRKLPKKEGLTLDEIDKLEEAIGLE